MGGYSQGCVTCKRRKIKCDELRPNCVRCSKRGIKCGGYPQAQLKFTIYGPPLAGGDRRHSADACPVQLEIPEEGFEPLVRRSGSMQATTYRLNSGLGNTSPLGFYGLVGIQPFTPYDSLPVNYECLKILDLARFARGQSLRQGVTNSVTGEKSSFKPAWPAPNSSYITYIPTRLGNSKVLDDAVLCVIHAFDAFVKDCPSANGSISHYLRALNSLNKALLSHEAYSAETLCAVMLLGVYELISSNEASSWVKHAGGASKLMQMRGTERWTSDFEKSLFQAHLPVVLTEAFISNKPCFLESEQWKQVIQDNNPLSELHYPTRGQFFAIGTSRARLQRDITDFLSDRTSQTETQASSLLFRARNRAAEMKSWFQMWSAGVAQKAGNPSTHGFSSSLFRTSLFTPGLEIVDRGDYRAYLGFCNGLCHANFHILSLEPSETIVAETNLITAEVFRVVECLVRSDYLDSSHILGTRETARLTYDLMDEWKGELEKRCRHQEPNEKYISFRLWLKYLHAHKVETGYEETGDIRLQGKPTQWPVQVRSS